MKRILFICHGNICRSPMAEFILKALVKAKGLEGEYYIESAATSTEEIGNPIYPPAKTAGLRIFNDENGVVTRSVVYSWRLFCRLDVLYFLDKWYSSAGLHSVYVLEIESLWM